MEMARFICTLPQPAIHTDMEAAVRGFGLPLDEGLRIEVQCFNRSIFHPETNEGLRRFNERDHPDLHRGLANLNTYSHLVCGLARLMLKVLQAATVFGT
jgi:hypothetical protein